MGLCFTYHPNLNFPVAMLTSELIYKRMCGNLKGQKCDCVMPLSDTEELQRDPNSTESNTQL